MGWLERRGPRLVCALVLGLGAGACSGSTPVLDGARHGEGVAHRDASREAPAPCLEAERLCATLTRIQVCQGGKWVDAGDCTDKKDTAGHPCTCSVTMMGICQYGGKACP